MDLARWTPLGLVLLALDSVVSVKEDKIFTLLMVTTVPRRSCHVRLPRMRAPCVGRYGALVIAFAFAFVAKQLNGQTEGTFRWPKGLTLSNSTQPDEVYSSPAVKIEADGSTTIYVGIRRFTYPQGGALFALKSDGSLKWPVPFETLSKTNPVDSGVFSSPAVGLDGTIYFGSDNGSFYAINGDGSKKWERNVGAPIGSSPVLGPSPDNVIYIMSGDFVLHAFTPAGEEKWKHGAAGYVFENSPAVDADGMIYCAAYDGSLLALNPGDGSVKWSKAANMSVFSSPAIATDGTVYFTSYDDGRLLAVSPNGEIKWTFPAAGAIAASPSIGADGTIYFGDGEGLFYAINPDGTQKWAAPKDIGAAIVSTAAVRGDGTIIFGANDQCVHALNLDGSIKWTSPPTDDAIISSPVIAPDGTIYVGSTDGKLYAIYGNGSPLSTYASWPMFHRDIAHSAQARPTSRNAYLVNLATRAQAGSNANLIVGFVVQGAALKNFLVRAVGPALAQFNVQNPLADPTLALHIAPSGATFTSNDNWSGDSRFPDVVAATGAAGAFALPFGSADSALAVLLAPANYTGTVGSADGGAGIALAEIYDADPGSSSARLVNLSTRGRVGVGDGVLIAGLVIGGNGTLRVLIRGVGPGLAQFNVLGFLARPNMTVYDAKSSPISGNTGWTSGGLTADLTAAMQTAGAFPLDKSSADSAVVLTLASGLYTIKASGVGDTTGEALVEVYILP